MSQWQFEYKNTDNYKINKNIKMHYFFIFLQSFEDQLYINFTYEKYFYPKPMIFRIKLRKYKKKWESRF